MYEAEIAKKEYEFLTYGGTIFFSVEVAKPMGEKNNYSYRVIWSEEDGEYIGLCDEFPSLSWLAPEPEQALQGIRQLVSEVVADL